MNVADVQMMAATDPQFRAALVADPRAALAEKGLELPADTAVRVVESTPQELVLSIPPLIDDDVEISEEALAGASGGTVMLAALGWGWVAIAGGTGAVVGGTVAAVKRWG